MEVDMKYIVSLQVMYKEDIWVEAKDQEEAIEKTLKKKGVRIGMPMRYDDSIEVSEVNTTDIDIND